LRDRVRHLTKGVAIYGAGDAAVQVVNFLLLAVYVKGGFLRDVDYGALALVGAIEAFAKVISRWGLDGAFMRYYHDRGADLPRLASTILWFLLGVDVLVFGTGLGLTVWLGPRLFADPGYVTALRVMLVNTFLISFTFLPFHSMRMRNEAASYSLFAFARSVGTLLLRIALVIILGLGLTGIYLADLVVTLALLPFLFRWIRPLVRPVFSTIDLRAALRFGLPRIPHGLAQQVLDGGNKLLLGGYITLNQLGVYQNGVTLGTGVKFFTSAFETAWAPFYYATARQADAREVFRKMTTYGVAVLALLVAGTSAVAHDVVLVMLNPRYLSAAPILPIIAVGMGFQGLYLLTSIGLNLTSRTEFYPVATFAAAAVGLGFGVLLMPQYGAAGAAVAYLLSYVTQASIAFVLARHFYPVSYEWARIARIVLAGSAAAVTAVWVVPSMPALAGLFVRGAVTVVTYGGLLWLSGFLRPTERAFMVEMARRLRRGAESTDVTGDGHD
jgi:O-antigen/teichoic acid export membrane protein